MYRFYGWQAADMTDANGLTPRDMYDLLLKAWRADTCAPRMRDGWSEENPTKGQCSITAFLAQDLFGGRVLGVPLGDGNYHCFNVVDGRAFDLTSEQFSRELSYEDCPEQRREDHFDREEKRRRYLLLRGRFLREYAVWLKHHGHNCCQAVLCACAARPDAELSSQQLKRVGAAFGGGMGCMEGTCGALVAAEMILGLRAYAGRPVARQARELHTAFADACGATICKALKGVGTGVVLCECDDCVRNAVGLCL